jgi:hypothetical protein
MRARAALAAAGISAAALATGCGATTNTSDPACAAVRIEPLYLASQAVGTAAQIPCVNAYPGGWSLGSLRIRDGKATFTLDSDRGGSKALTVTLQETCDVAGAIEVPSDQPGMARFDQMPDVSAGFRAIRAYRFDGGCVTYRFDVRSARAGALVDEASLAVGFLTRTEVRARMERMERS